MRLRLLMRGAGELEGPMLEVGAAGGEVELETLLYGEVPDGGDEGCRSSGGLL